MAIGMMRFSRRLVGVATFLAFSWLIPRTKVVAQTPTSPPTNLITVSPTANITNSPTSSPTFDPDFSIPECFNSTKVLFQAMLRASSFQKTEYILCPDTTFNIGRFDDAGRCCLDGDYSLFLRSRSTVKCGADGKSSNNCIFLGGNTQLFYIGTFFGDLVAQDVVVMGITFQSTSFLSTALANRGDITFIDCIWRDHFQSGTVFIAYADPSRESNRRLNALVENSGVDTSDPLQLAEFMMSRHYVEEWVKVQMEEAQRLQRLGPEEKEEHRQLQAAFTMSVEFEDCKFIDNRQGPVQEGGIPLLGVMTIITPDNPATLRGCTFSGNKYDGSDGNSNGYAVQSLGSPLTVFDTCFDDNSFIGFGPIQAFDGAEFDYGRNWVSRDDVVWCDFGAASAKITPESYADVDCIYYDLAECRSSEIRVFGAPTASPTDKPSSATPLLRRVLPSIVAGLCAWLYSIHV